LSFPTGLFPWSEIDGYYLACVSYHLQQIEREKAHAGAGFEDRHASADVAVEYLGGILPPAAKWVNQEKSKPPRAAAM